MYNKDIDYQALIDKAVQTGNLRDAAKYEQARNAKITGEGLNYDTTNKYSQYLMPDGYTGSSNNVYTFNDDQNRIQQQMNQNSIDWWNADATGKTVLENANKQLAANLGSGVGFDSQTGTWSGVADQPISMKTGVDMALPTWDLDSYLSSNPKPTYDSQYSDLINAKLDQILNREAFSYDLDSDPLYQQYKKQYIREGNRSMNDTLASMATDAGGMNSWAVTAAQQAGDYHMAQLNDRIPELYQLAYSMYMDDLNIDQENLGILQQLDNVDYNRYRDDVSDWYTDYNNAYTDYRDSMGDYKWGTEFNFDAEQTAIDRDWQQKQWDYGIERDDYEDGLTANNTAYDRAIEMLKMGVMPNSNLLAQAGITDAEAKAIQAKVNGALVGTGGSTGGGTSSSGGGGSSSSSSSSSSSNKGGTGYNNGKLSESQVKAMQKYYGVSADGKWGPASSKAAGGKSADEAWLEYQNKTTGENYDPKLSQDKPAAGDKVDKTPAPADDDEDMEVANAHGDSWVQIPMKGRMTWTEVEAYVNSGKIKETVNPDGKLYYTWVG